MFVDLTGYTALAASLDPEEVYRSLRPGLQALQGIVEEFGGSVPHILGDGFMAVFGVPTAHEDDAERAVRAGLAVRDHVHELNTGRSGVRFPEVHAGVGSGEVMVAPSPEASGFAVVGDTVNTASRIADLAGEGTVLVDAVTKQSTKGAVRYGRRRVRSAKGKPHLETYEALGLVPDESRAPVGRLASASFVDREQILQALVEEVTRTERANASRVLVVIGEPGVGKSRLGTEFTRTLTGASSIVGRCRPFAQRLPLAALAEAVAQAASISLDDRGPATDAALKRFAERIEADREAARHLARGLGILTGTLQIPAGQARGSLAEGTWAARSALSGLAVARPLVVLLDDFHWADPELRRFIEVVNRDPLDRPVLFLAFARSEPAGGLPTIDLGSLGEQEMGELANAILRGQAPAELLHASISRAGGNPLFLEETLGMLIDARTLVSRTGRWRVTDAEGLDALPSAIRLVIAARLDGLPPEEKRALQLVSVAGGTAWDRLIGAISDIDDPASVLSSLDSRGLIHQRARTSFPGTVEYEIKHVLIREVSYESVPRSERARLHMKVATWLRRQSPSRREEPLARLAYHCERAWRLSKSKAEPHPPAEPARLAASYLNRWAARAFAYQAKRAERIYAQGIQIVEEAGEAVEAATRAKLRIGRAECLLEMGRSTEAMADAKHARKEAERASSEALSARALLALGRAQSDQGRSASARRLVKDALGRFESLGDIRGQGWAHHRLSETFSRTDMAREIQHLKQAHALFTRSRDSWGRAIVAQDLAYMLTTRGDAEFERWFAEARRLADVEGDLRSRAEVLRTLGYVRFYRGDNVGAIEAMREARPIAVEAGERYAEADTLIIEAMAAAVVDGPSAAVALSNEVLRVGRELRSARITMLGSLALARAVLRSGSPERAGKALATAARIQRDQGIAVESPEVGRIRAQIMIDRGSWAGVRGVSNEVGQAIGASDLLPLWRPLPKLLTGQAMLGAGRHEAAYEELVEAVDLARKGGAKGTLAMASALRDQSSLFHPGMADPVPLSSPEPEVRATLAENEGISAARAGDAARALERFADAVALRTRVGKSSFLVRALGMQAEALRRLGDRRGATRLVRRAGSLLSALETPERSKPALLHPLAGLDN